MLRIKDSRDKQAVTKHEMKILLETFKTIKYYSKENIGFYNDLDCLTYYLLNNEKTIFKTLNYCIKNRLTLKDFENSLKLVKPKLIACKYTEKVIDTLIGYLSYIIGTNQFFSNSRIEEVGNLIEVENDGLGYNNIVDLKKYYNNVIFCINEILLKEYLISFKNIKKIVLPISCGFNNLVKSDNSGYYSIFFEYKHLYETIFKTLKEVSNLNVLTVIIPEVSTFEDYCFWYVTIKRYLGKNVKVGIIVDSLIDIYEFNDFELIEDCLIDLDEIIIPKVNNEYCHNHFKREVVPIIREIKAHLMDQNISPTIINKSNIDKEIVSKCLKMGFNKYNSSEINKENTIKCIENHLKRRKLENNQ